MLKLTIQYMTSMNYFLILSNNMNTALIRWGVLPTPPPPPPLPKKTTENIRYEQNIPHKPTSFW